MRIALAQLNYKIGDFDGNCAKLEKVIREKASQADLIVFSELCLCGYYPKDLIYHAGFFEAQEKALKKIKACTLEMGISVVIGLVTKNKDKGQPYYNSLHFIHQGEIVFTYHKKLLPVYNIFNEARHFAVGKLSGIYEFGGTRFGFLICEDGWASSNDFLYECNPVDDFVGKNLDAIICINGSPNNIGKQEERYKRFSEIAKRCDAPLLFTNQVGGNDDIVFDGTSFIVDKMGNLQGCLKQFEEDCGILELENKVIYPSGQFTPLYLLQDAGLFYRQTILGLQDYVYKCKFNKVVIGISGGIDSAVTLALASIALGSEKVIGLAMPSRYSSPSSLNDAKTLCNNFKVPLFIISIEEEFALTLQQFNTVFGEKPHSITEQNIQARLRGRILMEYSNQTGALVLSTGNKSELSVGYTTLYGDMTGGFNLIGDLYKTDVYKLANYINEMNPQTIIPLDIIKKIPSAELAPHQKDSDTLPEYAVLDPILKLYIERDLLPKEEFKKYEELVKKLPAELVTRIFNMVDNAEFKRRQSPPIVRVQRRAFGFGRQLPIAATYPK